MTRPGFALSVLLGWMGLSLLIIRAAHCDDVLPSHDACQQSVQANESSYLPYLDWIPLHEESNISFPETVEGAEHLTAPVCSTPSIVAMTNVVDGHDSCAESTDCWDRDACPSCPEVDKIETQTSEVANETFRGCGATLVVTPEIKIVDEAVAVPVPSDIVAYVTNALSQVRSKIGDSTKLLSIQIDEALQSSQSLIDGFLAANACDTTDAVEVAQAKLNAGSANNVDLNHKSNGDSTIDVSTMVESAAAALDVAGASLSQAANSLRSFAKSYVAVSRNGSTTSTR